jgi:hypothetical protein
VLLLLAALQWPALVSRGGSGARSLWKVSPWLPVLRTLDGALTASGDSQSAKNGEVESRMLLHFKDGSLFEERVVFTQQRVFTLKNYRLMQRGPAFTDDTEISLERATGRYRVKTKPHKDGKEEVHEGTLDDLPLDVYNGGMILTVAKNLPKGVSETVHTVAFTPKPRLIQLELAAGEQKVPVGALARTATDYVFKPKLGVLLKVAATVLDEYLQTAMPDRPAKCQLLLGSNRLITGSVWRLEPTSMGHCVDPNPRQMTNHPLVLASSYQQCRDCRPPGESCPAARSGLNQRFHKNKMVDQALPRTGWKGRIAALKHIPTVLKIVWQASPLLSILGLVFRGLVGLIPISMLWISKLIIDRVVHAVSQPGTDFAEIGWLLVSEFGLGCAGHVLTRIIDYCDSLLADKFTQLINVRILEHSSKLDLVSFESPAFYDKLERAPRRLIGSTC